MENNNLLGNMRNRWYYFFVLVLLFSCGEDKPVEHKKKSRVKSKTAVSVERPRFNQDSAYVFVKSQVDFGPRVPNTEAHRKCAVYLEKTLQRYGLNTILQKSTVTAFNGKPLNMINIIGEYKPALKKRIMLFAHWDSRPFADADDENRTKAILGANDGASGVGVLLEVARQLSLNEHNVGVDIIFFDAEDYGRPSSDMVSGDSDTWCLGSQYWSKNKHRENYSAEYGILLDMVGASNAYFTHESISMQYAPDVVRKVWKAAANLGYSNMFVNSNVGFYVTDDHKYVNELGGVPSIDIIHYDRNTGSFHHSWHTHDDNMDVIDKITLKAVGETLLAVIKQEQ